MSSVGALANRCAAVCGIVLRVVDTAVGTVDPVALLGLLRDLGLLERVRRLLSGLLLLLPWLLQRLRALGHLLVVHHVVLIIRLRPVLALVLHLLAWDLLWLLHLGLLELLLALALLGLALLVLVTHKGIWVVFQAVVAWVLLVLLGGHLEPKDEKSNETSCF